MSRARIAVGALLALLALASARDLARLGSASPWNDMAEFADFYCAGSVLNAGASPYLYEPLHACEHRVAGTGSFRSGVFRSDPALAVPVPQPAYDFAPFAGLAMLPYAQARAAYGAAILAAVALCALALWGTGVALDLAAAALVLSTAYASLETAQIVPFALLALTLCGLALARGRDWLAGIAAACALVEPTAGVPVVAAVLIFVPRARVAAVATGLALAAVAWRVAGAHTLQTYLTAVLPAHAGSELAFPFQYSLTYALAAIGASPVAARAAGAISYVAVLALGLWIAPAAARRFGRPELLVFVPALCAVIGGPFLHQEELCFALPAALVLASGARGRARNVGAAALCTLAIPWIALWGHKQLFLAAIFVCALILARLRVSIVPAAVTLCSIAAALYLFELQPPHLPVPPSVPASVYAPGELTEREWRDYTASRSTNDPLWFAVKIPAWAALIALLTVAARAGATDQPESAEGRRLASISRRI